jgi:hypothetical protein
MKTLAPVLTTRNNNYQFVLTRLEPGRHAKEQKTYGTTEQWDTNFETITN